MNDPAGNDARKHNYYKKLLQLYDQGTLGKPGLTEIDICHDDWCAIYRGGYCNCNPEVRVRLPVERN